MFADIVRVLFRSMAAVLVVAALAGAPRGPAHATPFVLGTADGAAGDIVGSLVASAQAALDVAVVRSTTFDAAFFGQVDAFVFANGLGDLSVTLGPTARANLLSFVTGGGHAYLGLDAISGAPPFDNDGAEIAALFGFAIADRQPLTEGGTITDTTHAITTGPFQPASTFVNSFFGKFEGAVPTGGSIIGTSDDTGRAVLAFLAADALGAGSGKVYIYADELPLRSGGDSKALFQNALFDMGAELREVRTVQVAEPASLAIFGLGLAGLAVARRRRQGA